MSSTPQPHPEEPKNKRASLTIGTIAAFIAIITPAAYLLGFSFRNGYISAFGVTDEAFPISTSDIYVFSYHAVGHILLAIGELASSFLTTLFKTQVICWTLVAVAFLTYCIYMLLRFTRSGSHPRIQWILSKVKVIVSRLHWKNNDFTKALGIVGLTSYGVIALATTAVSIALFWWIISMSARSKGTDLAQERIKIYLDNGCQVDAKTKWDSCVLVTDNKGNIIHEGLLIAVNDKNIAIFKKDGSYIFTRSDDFLLRRVRH